MYRFILVALVLATPANAGPAAHTSAAPIPVVLPHTPPPAIKPATPAVVPAILPATPLPRKEVAPAKPIIPNTVIPHNVKTTQVTGLPLTIVQAPKPTTTATASGGTITITDKVSGTLTQITGMPAGTASEPVVGKIVTSISGSTVTETVTISGKGSVPFTESFTTSGTLTDGNYSLKYSPNPATSNTVQGTIIGKDNDGVIVGGSMGGNTNTTWSLKY